jgi:hypothetical protein
VYDLGGDVGNWRPALLGRDSVGSMVLRWLPLALVASLLVGCGDEESSETLPPVEPPPTCGPNDITLADDSCVAVGVPVDGCGNGFAHDGDAGCLPVLPAEACAPGLMAVPGEESCREVAPCGEPPWGMIPIDGSTQHVDRSYAGGSNDGSASRPWLTVQQGIDAAAAGAIIAIAEGRYGSGASIEGKAVRLWGRCPALVEIGDAGTPLAAIDIRTGADGTELRDLSVVSNKLGIVMSGSRDVLVDRVWVHDGADRAINVQDSLGPSSMTVSHSLIENNQYLGVLNFSSTVIVDATVIRDTVPHSSGLFGMGVSAQEDLMSLAPADLTITGSLIERNAQLGVYVSGSTAYIDSTVVRDTKLDAANEFGRGVQLENGNVVTQQAIVTLERSVVERNIAYGVFIHGSQATVRATVVRDTQTDINGGFGQAIGAQIGTDDIVSTATIEHSLIDTSRGTGVIFTSSVGIMDSTVVRNTLAAPNGTLGDAIVVYTMPASNVLGEASVNQVLVRDSARSAVSNFAGIATLRASRFLCQQFEFNGELVEQLEFQFSDGGDNLCGCSAPTEPCKVVSSMLQPPAPIGDRTD